MSLFDELKRRNVIRVGAMYAVIAWLILQIADVVLGNIVAPDWVFRAVLLLVILGFPLALLFAWAFELTPQGLKREKDVERSESATQQTARALDRTIIAVLAVALVYFAYDKYSSYRVSAEELAAAGRQALTEETVNISDAAASNVDGIASIAVLPFVNMSSDPEQEYFSDGISEELLNLLAKIPQFRVAGRTSSFAFKGKDMDLREIGSSLGVSSILEGSVRKGGVRVRITAQLVNAEDGFHLWSETYDRKLTDIFAVQDEIAAAVVAQLKVTLLGTPMPRGGDESLAANVAAYDLYLKGMAALSKLGPSNFQQAAAFFEQTVALAPESALAWARLADANTRFASQAQDGVDAALARAREAVAKAFELDDKVPEAYIAAAHIKLAFDWDWNGAEMSIQRALELRPGDLAAKDLSSLLYSIHGDLKRAIVISRELIAQDPLNLRILSRLIVDLIDSGEPAEAEAIVRARLSQAPSMSFLYGYLAFSLSVQGRSEEAAEAAAREPVGFIRLVSLAISQHSLGNARLAEAAQQQLLQDYGDRAAYQQAMLYSMWGDHEKAIAWLERAYAARDPGLIGLKTAIAFRPLRALPGYLAILEKMNLAD